MERDGSDERAGDRALLDDLATAVGPDRVRAEPLELSLYARDAGIGRGEAAVVCFPGSASDVASAVAVAARHGRPFVARGSGTGLAGGATPVGGAVVIVTTHLNRVLEVDPVNRVAWVEPGVLNLDLSRTVRHLGLHYAPDPSSQAACTIGGNVATNAGGPHCLAAGDAPVLVATANPGCGMHLAAAGVDVRHPAELLAAALEHRGAET